MLRSLVLSLAVVLALTTRAIAGEHGGVSYAVPEAWKEGPDAIAMVLSPPDLAKGQVLFVMILPAMPTGDTPADKQFGEMVKLLNEDAKILRRGKIVTQGTGQLVRHQQTLWVRDKEYGKHQRLYAQALFGEKRTFALVVSTHDKVLARHKQDVLDIIASLQIAPIH